MILGGFSLGKFKWIGSCHMIHVGCHGTNLRISVDCENDEKNVHNKNKIKEDVNPHNKFNTNRILVSKTLVHNCVFFRKIQIVLTK